ncbi:zinc finger protein 423 homolog [Sitophilus oryzae]|uniref:Zinc finger protein 423 homolog n=1 Tax=Sitophilus oryzae TaxID=7048 RepID=A0A6J2XBF0_SITOR|nr:zinc finger protein 423 homolog [Sitophilus oryzae]
MLASRFPDPFQNGSIATLYSGIHTTRKHVFRDIKQIEISEKYKKMKMLFKGHSTRLEMVIEKIHSHKEVTYQDSEIIRNGFENNSILPEISDSPTSLSFSDTEEEKDCDEITKGMDFESSISENSHSISKFLCKYCPREFKHKRSRDRHIKLHTGDKKYKCLQCESAFARSDHLKIHLKTHEIKKQYNCHRCGKGYNTASALSFHKQIHKKEMEGTIESSSVSSCESSAKNTNTEINYFPIRHPEDLGESMKIKTICVYCFRWFSSIDVMQEHVQLCHRNLSNSIKIKNEIPSPEDIRDIKLKDIFFEAEQDDLTQSKKDMHLFNGEESQKTFICACCYERLPSFKSFLFHMESHVPSSKLESCLQCGEDLGSSLSLSSHLFKHSMLPLNNYVCCCHCNKFFENSEALQTHLSQDHVVTVYKCSICDQLFENIGDMKVHLHVAHVSNEVHYECNLCSNSNVFHDKTSAELHFSKHHSDKLCVQPHNDLVLYSSFSSCENGLIGKDKSLDERGPSSFQCIYCKEYCKTKNDLQLHLRSHRISDKSRHKCNICDEVFASSTDLANHKLMHCKIIDGNICVQCKTILVDEQAFFKHQVKHNDASKPPTKLNLILPSICIICGQTLQSDKEIELHAKFHLKFLTDQSATPASSSPYSEKNVLSNDRCTETSISIDPSFELQCYLCKKSFSSKENLQVHLIEHNFFGINQFSCYVCSSVFTGAGGLQTHLFEHNLTEKPYQCTQCSAGFFFRAELDNHRYLHNFRVQFNYFTSNT